MNKKIIVILSLIVIAILAALVAVIFIFFPKSPTQNFDDFAKCLASKNITMYGTPWCEWCQKEEALFGKSFNFVPFVDCSKTPQECVVKGVNATPTWIFSDPPAMTSSSEVGRGGKKIEGYQTLEQLSQESGCLLP